jgi:hypothetical protein
VAVDYALAMILNLRGADMLAMDCALTGEVFEGF